MIAAIRSVAFAMAVSCISVPAFAQTAEPEEPRTTYQVTYLKLAPDGQERWIELMEDHYNKARSAAGLPLPAIHWFADGPWDIMLVTELQQGLATLDSHEPPAATAFNEAFVSQEGSKQATEALDKELDKLVIERERYFSHTHP